MQASSSKPTETLAFYQADIFLACQDNKLGDSRRSWAKQKENRAERE
jgi:hypothetical protein